MSRTKVALYSFALDGGAGAIILRGTRLAELEGYLSWSLMTLSPVTAMPGTLLDFGYAGAPTFFTVAGAVDPSVFSTVPSLEISALATAYPHVHFAAAEPVLMTISGGAITGGEFVVLIEAVRP